MNPLSVNQKLAVKKLEELRVGALFMEPGTGKTRVAVELINSSQADFVFFLAPFQTKANLKAELDKWGLQKKYRIDGIESLSNSDRLYMELLEQVEQCKRAFVVCDESLKIKNIHAKRTQRILELGQKAYYRLVLNGTPVSKNVLDIYPQMEFLSPKILNMRYIEFWSKFVKSKKIIDSYRERTVVIDSINIEYLYSLIEPYVFEAKLNLGISENEHEVEYIADDPQAYWDAKQEMLDKIVLMGDVDFLAMTQKMQHAYSLDTAHIKICRDLVKTLHKPSIIFVKYLDTKAKLKELFPQCKILTYGKGALGLNLQDYKNVIFFEKSWDYAQLEQAKRRIYRLGQSEDVNYYFLTGNLGLEKMIDQSISKKTSLLNLFKQTNNRKEFANDF